MNYSYVAGGKYDGAVQIIDEFISIFALLYSTEFHPFLFRYVPRVIAYTNSQHDVCYPVGTFMDLDRPFPIFHVYALKRVFFSFVV